MAPIRIRYHVPTNSEENVVRYNDPLERKHRNRPRQHDHHRLRDNKSDFDYDYRPKSDDFEHMRRSVPDKYWGPYNPYLYKDMRHWDGREDDKYYDFKYDSNRRHATEANYRDEYEPEPRQEDRRYGGRYEPETIPPPYPKHDPRFESHRGPPGPEYDRGFESHRRPAQSDYERGYYPPRPLFDSEYDRGGYRSDRHPVRGSYDRGYDYHQRGRGRDNYNSRRPAYVQSEIILRRNNYRPLPYLGDPNRKPHEHRRDPAHPPTHRSYYQDHPRYHPDEYRSPHPHYHPSPRSEIPDTYSSPYPYPDDRVYESSPPMKKGHRRVHHHVYCDASPEKSSKFIPTMHYDELRCPYCQDKLQTYQDEVLAYPWTVQTFRPRLPLTERLPSAITPSVLSATVRDATIATVGTKNNNINKTDDDKKTAVTNKTAGNQTEPANQKPDSKASAKQDVKGKENKKDADKKTQKADEKKAESSKAGQKNGKAPLSDTGNVRSNNDGSKVGDKRGNRSNQKKPGLATVKESVDEYDDTILNATFDDYDDIRPQDSVSNVSLPPLRAYSKGPNNTEHKRMSQARARAETEVTPYSYPSGRYFPSLEYVPPKPAQATPLPRRHDDIDPFRRLTGRYFNRQNGKMYDYDVNYDGRRIFSDRRPIR